ncbi:MAG: PaaI family thioesterase, partial [Pseudomonadota bacterium]
MSGLQLDKDALSAFLTEVFPQTSGTYAITELAPMRATMRYFITEQHLRPGGTVSGPTMFTLADLAFYAAVLAMIGREPLTVTTNLNINFLRKPAPGDLLGEARILKLGRTLATGDVTLRSLEDPQPVAHAQATYAIPR